ncbi:hypothetical protein [Hymenobacter jeollabukensis]|uniref:Uncharacterized protein n=1 Tax=Hymenobacter jeollabukensis TaxID=2025313 RepID=A0A5R8WWP5_9BACT|nr:hypothetical protein [Hymenobacter jeollabukensis]TLM96652.1 hypothetical protein FDY95_01255 [Hymenobacter jeollabukensis]
MDALDGYELEKWLWTEADFETMGWHDASVYAWRLQGSELLMDIDYIFQWNQPEVEGTSFTFWVAPATLVFHEVQNVEFDFDFIGTEPFKAAALEIDSLELETPNEWTIQFHNGYLGFTATGFSQYIRKAPSFEFGQQVSYPNRAGNSFERVTGEVQADAFNFAEFRKTNIWRLYQLMLDQARVRQQLEQLLDERAAGKLALKDFLMRKRDLQDRINYLGIELRGTRFART